MKNKNKIGILAAVGITLSVASIVVRVDVASATGSYGSAHSYDWSPRYEYHGWTRHKWLEDDSHHYHSHYSNDEDDSCSCQTDDMDHGWSQDETTDETGPIADESDSNQTDTDGYGDSCQDSDEQNENESESTDDEQPADDAPESPSGDQPEDPAEIPVDNGHVNGDSDTPVDGEDEDAEQPPAQSTDPAVELSVDTKVKVNDGAFVAAETDGDAAAGHVGDSATWQITVTPDQVDPADTRIIKVQWTAPDNVEVIGSIADNGTYDGSVWVIPITKLPAVLTVSTTIAKPGLGASNAVISHISCEAVNAVDGYCEFKDGVANNNANPAGVLASAATASNENTGSTQGEPTGNGTGAGTGTLGASTGNQSGQVNSNSGVLGANTTRGGQGGEGSQGGQGVVHAKETDANGVLGAATAWPESEITEYAGTTGNMNSGQVLAASASAGALANTGVSAYAMVILGVLMCSVPVVLVAATTKRR